MYFTEREKLFAVQIDRMAEQFCEKPAITCAKKTITYTEMKQYADATSIKLLKSGMQKGNKVVLWGYNCIEWMILFLAVTQAGGVAVLMNYGLLPDEVSVLSRMVNASFGFFGKNSVSKRSHEKAIKSLTDSGIPSDNVFSFQSFIPSEIPLIDDNDYELLKQAKEAVRPRDTQVIIYTTGTSSVPKAVQLSSFAIFSNVEGLFDLLTSGASETFCLALPLYHSYGMTMNLFYLDSGKHVFLSPELKPEILMDLISKNNILDMSSVGAVYNMLLDLPGFDEKLAGKMHMCVVGGSFTSPVNMIRMEKKFKGAKFICGYGQTECSPVISMESYEDPLERRAISVGHPLPNHEVKIMSYDGVFLQQGEIGEIVVKGPSLMNGYFGLPNEKQAIDQNGWLHTEDLGRINEFDMIEFSGRIKDIINRGGENISPMQIEHALLSEPEIKDVKVMGSPHPIWGESVEACIVLKTEYFNEDDFRERLKMKLASYKVPAHFLIYDVLPLSPNGKLDQRKLRADMLERLAALSEQGE